MSRMNVALWPCEQLVSCRNRSEGFKQCFGDESISWTRDHSGPQYLVDILFCLAFNQFIDADAVKRCQSVRPFWASRNEGAKDTPLGEAYDTVGK